MKKIGRKQAISTDVPTWVHATPKQNHRPRAGESQTEVYIVQFHWTALGMQGQLFDVFTHSSMYAPAGSKPQFLNGAVNH
ncbi:hypothetical protein STEG23_012704, partial [Scotinomys teguina]